MIVFYARQAKLQRQIISMVDPVQYYIHVYVCESTTVDREIFAELYFRVYIFLASTYIVASAQKNFSRI